MNQILAAQVVSMGEALLQHLDLCWLQSELCINCMALRIIFTCCRVPAWDFGCKSEQISRIWNVGWSRKGKLKTSTACAVVIWKVGAAGYTGRAGALCNYQVDMYVHPGLWAYIYICKLAKLCAWMQLIAQHITDLLVSTYVSMTPAPVCRSLSLQRGRFFFSFASTALENSLGIFGQVTCSS